MASLTPSEVRLLESLDDAITAELAACDPAGRLCGPKRSAVKLELLQNFFEMLASNNRLTLTAADRGRIRGAVSASLPARFVRRDRVVCNVGGARPWEAGVVHAVHEPDPDDGSGRRKFAYIVLTDPPTARLVSVPQDSNDLIRAEVCFGQRAGALWFTRMSLPQAARRRCDAARCSDSERCSESESCRPARVAAPRRGAAREAACAGGRRFGVGDRVSCAVEDSSGLLSDWAAGTVRAVDVLLKGAGGMAGGVVAYDVRLDGGGGDGGEG
ncbi:hypothetical protein EMIHUDRAFT_457239, partial [Emiliania huxleyi CCMP1516]|uniref:Uncharacterized protein n=2 Tax=Emiliania huxleyi TaxID=2903 RepID=A0A0D3IX01_EMIH1